MSTHSPARETLDRAGLLRGTRWLRHAPRRSWNLARRGLEERVDGRQLRERLPELALYSVGADLERLALEPLYAEYIDRVSTEEMAISLELAQFLAWFCSCRSPRRILDLGSGFSSVVFREWVSRTDSEAVVWSVDDDEEWLALTRGFLTDHGLSSERVMSWEAFRATGERGFDLVFHDLGHTDSLRRDALPEILARTASGGWLVLDDVHHPGYERFVRRLLATLGLDAWSLRAYTRDRFGRYAQLVAR